MNDNRLDQQVAATYAVVSDITARTAKIRSSFEQAFSRTTISEIALARQCRISRETIKRSTRTLERLR
jgi:hypothetical protein